MAETIPQFYKRIQRCDPKLDTTYSKGKEYFNIFSRRCNFGTVQFSYRDFYKVTLIVFFLDESQLIFELVNK